MTTKTCTACASSNPVDAAFCSQCGNPFDTIIDTAAASQPQPVAPAGDPVYLAPAPPPMIAERPSVQAAPPTVPENKEMPCLVKVVGGFFGCLIGLIIGLCLSLICALPVTYAISGGSGSPVLQVAIIVIVILVIITTVLGILNGPGFLGKILTSIGDTFKWITGSKK